MHECAPRFGVGHGAALVAHHENATSQKQNNLRVYHPNRGHCMSPSPMSRTICTRCPHRAEAKSVGTGAVIFQQHLVGTRRYHGSGIDAVRQHNARQRTSLAPRTFQQNKSNKHRRRYRLRTVCGNRTLSRFGHGCSAGAVGG